MKKRKAQDAPHPRPQPRYPEKISSDAAKRIFSTCDDFIIREIWPAGDGPTKLSLCWLDGVCAGDSISDRVIRPLTDPIRMADYGDPKNFYEAIFHGGVFAFTAKDRTALDDVINDIVQGFCALIFDDLGKALTFEVRTTQTRSISQPTLEKSVKGAKDAFVETLRINTSLVRRKLRSPQLKAERTTVGRRSATSVSMMYVEGIANPDTVNEVRTRLDDIDIDGLVSSGSLEQYVSDVPLSPFPQLIHTERPDKFAQELLEGRVGLIVDGLPIGFLLPAGLTSFMKTAEDRSQQFLVASALTLLRWGSLLVSCFLPAFYVAVAMYHQEMLPLQLLSSVIQSKQHVPFSTAVEIVGLLLAFELLQEAGLRLPDPVGQTVSIVGALIVGQSAVEAKVVSPIAVIIIALAGICGYTQPSQDMGSALRLCRFFLVILAMALGMFGVVMGATLLIWHLCCIESCGVSYTAALSSSGIKGALRSLTRPPLWILKHRDESLRTPDKRNQR